MRKYLSVLVVGLCLTLLATGCGSKKETKKEIEKDKKIEKTEYMTVGNEEGAAFSVILKNTIGKDITGIAVKSSSETEYPVNMMKENETWKNNEEVKLFYAPVTSDDQTEATMFSMKLTCVDQSVYEVMALDFNAVEKASICCDDSIPIVYLEYKDKDGNKISTKEQEIAVKEKIEAEAAAQAQAEAEAAAAAEAAAQAQAEAEAAAAAEAAKQKQYNNNAGSVPSQNTNQCLGGDALTY